ncbi:MAG TPA: hypothetical protein VK559_05405 [Ferruginibacter sp.]|nr:hypothetical protein [Ferruginibacter sp.]
MHKRNKLFVHFFLFIGLFLLSCVPLFIKAQKSIDKTKAEKLYNEVIPLYDSYILLQYNDPDSAKKILPILIQRCIELYNVDTSNKLIGNYLVKCYYDQKDDEKAIFWCEHQIACHSYSENINNFEMLAQIYLREGDIKAAEEYTSKSIPMNKIDPNMYTSSPVFLANVKFFIDNVVNGNDTAEISLLKSKNILPIPYVNNMFKFLLPYAEKSMIGIKSEFENDTLYKIDNSVR